MKISAKENLEVTTVLDEMGCGTDLLTINDTIRHVRCWVWVCQSHGFISIMDFTGPIKPKERALTVWLCSPGTAQ